MPQQAFKSLVGLNKADTDHNKLTKDTHLFSGSSDRGMLPRDVRAAQPGEGQRRAMAATGALGKWG